MTGVRPSALAGTDEQAALADAVSGFAERAGLTQQARAALDQDLDRLPVGWPSLADQELLALPWDSLPKRPALRVITMKRRLALIWHERQLLLRRAGLFDGRDVARQVMAELAAHTKG